jgi:tetratricopeptide (TPR) repeat protein
MKTHIAILLLAAQLTLQANAEETKPTIQSLSSNAVALYKAGNINQAKEQFAEAVKMAEKADPNGVFLARCLVNLAACQRDLKQYEDSERDFKRGLAIYEKKPDKKDLANALQQYARLLRITGRSAEAAEAKAKAEALQLEPIKKNPADFTPGLDLSFLDFELKDYSYFLSGKVTNNTKEPMKQVQIWVYGKLGLKRVDNARIVYLSNLAPGESTNFNYCVGGEGKIDGYEIVKVRGGDLAY